jgi:hypothetical protein
MASTTASSDLGNPIEHHGGGQAHSASSLAGRTETADSGMLFGIRHRGGGRLPDARILAPEGGSLPRRSVKCRDSAWRRARHVNRIGNYALGLRLRLASFRASGRISNLPTKRLNPQGAIGAIGQKRHHPQGEFADYAEVARGPR